MTTEHNFKQGGYAEAQDGSIVRIEVANPDCKRIVVTERREYATTYPKSEVTPLDRRTAFLRKLGALLREFDAEIGYGGIRFLKGMEITFGTDTPRIRYNQCTINADNIMDFDKE